MTPLNPGIYFDNTRGWHISALVVELAVNAGWLPTFDDPDLQHALDLLNRDGPEEMEDFIAQTDPEMTQWLEDGATEYLQTLIPEGCTLGYSEGFGDWGVWEPEEDAA